jgi:hypothetical protein
MKIEDLIKSIARSTSGIYKITNPTGKVYIGQSRCIRVRMLSYKRLDLKYQPKLKNSILKYGLDNHKFEIIEVCNLDSLNIRERYWQDFYNVCDKKLGLNCMLVASSEKVAIVSEETREKISKAHKGVAKAKGVIDNMIKASPNKVPVFQYTSSGIFVTKHESIKHAARLYNINSSHITSCCKGNVKSVRGFLWSYEEKDMQPIKLKEVPVEQYSLEGDLICVYVNIKTASKGTGIKPSAISNNLHNKSKTSGGFKFKFKC